MSQQPLHLLVTATLDALYSSTIVALRFESANQFAVQLSGSLLRLKAGHITDGEYRSQEELPDRHVLDVELMDWVAERAVRDESAQGAQNRYGVSFYPFVSSFLRGSVTVVGNSRPLIRYVVDVPDTVRPIYKQAEVLYDSELSGEPRHAHGSERSRFIFTANHPAGGFQSHIALRFSASRLAELITYPTAYYALSLAGIATAALIAPPGVVVAAVGALWTFMLREWSVAKVPRRHTILSALYLISAALAAAWALLWELFGWWSAVAIPIVGTLILTFTKARQRFDRAGTLPRYLARFWSWRVENSN